MTSQPALPTPGRAPLGALRTLQASAWLLPARRAPARQAEWSLYAITLSGLLLVQGLELPWALISWTLLAHVVGSVLLLSLIVGPYWLRHRARLRTSHSPWMKAIGRTIELSLVALLLSGAYLILVGNPGGTAGRVAHEVHLLGTAPLAIALLLHAPRSMRLFLARKTGSGGVRLPCESP